MDDEDSDQAWGGLPSYQGQAEQVRLLSPCEPSPSSSAWRTSARHASPRSHWRCTRLGLENGRKSVSAAENAPGAGGPPDVKGRFRPSGNNQEGTAWRRGRGKRRWFS